MATQRRQQFEERLTNYIEQSYPEMVFDIETDALAARVRRMVDRALAYGIEEEGDVAKYSGWSFELGENFEMTEEYAWALNILHSPHLEGREKVREMEEELEAFEEDVSESDEDLGDDQDDDDVDVVDPEYDEFNLPILDAAELEELA